MADADHDAVPSADVAGWADDGWSLVEMLVAVGLLAMLMVMLANAATSIRGTLATAASMSRQTVIEAAGRHLRHVISGAVPLAQPDAGSRQTRLVGGPQGLEFVSAYAPQGQYDGFYVVRLAQEPTSKPGLFDLVEVRTLYRQRAARDSAEPARPQTRHVLVDGIAAVALGYHGRRDGAQAWHSDWAGRSALPDMISVDVAFPPGDRRFWSKLVVPLPSK